MFVVICCGFSTICGAYVIICSEFSITPTFCRYISSVFPLIRVVYALYRVQTIFPCVHFALFAVLSSLYGGNVVMIYPQCKAYVWDPSSSQPDAAILVCFRGKVESKMEGKTESMACILKRHKLGHLTEVFLREKITPDIVSHLSVHEINQLGVNNWGDMINLRMECSTYGNRKPQREVLGCGTPSFNIPKSMLEYHLQGFKIKDIASMLSVSESTVYRRMRSFGLSALDFSDICDEQLDRHLSELSKEFPFCGEELMAFLLRERGIKVQRMKLRDSIHRVDEKGVSERKKGRLQRRVYNV